MAGLGGRRIRGGATPTKAVKRAVRSGPPQTGRDQKKTAAALDPNRPLGMLTTGKPYAELCGEYFRKRAPTESPNGSSLNSKRSHTISIRRRRLTGALYSHFDPFARRRDSQTRGARPRSGISRTEDT